MGSGRADEVSQLLRSAATILRDDAAYIRLKRQDFGTADPIPRVENTRRLATLLDEAANLREGELGRFVSSNFTPGDLSVIERIAGSLRPSDAAASDKNVRERYYEVLHDTHSFLAHYLAKSSTRRQTHN
jgi:hypothetical protein